MGALCRTGKQPSSCSEPSYPWKLLHLSWELRANDGADGQRGRCRGPPSATLPRRPQLIVPFYSVCYAIPKVRSTGHSIWSNPSCARSARGHSSPTPGGLPRDGRCTGCRGMPHSWGVISSSIRKACCGWRTDRGTRWIAPALRKSSPACGAFANAGLHWIGHPRASSPWQKSSGLRAGLSLGIEERERRRINGCAGFGVNSGGVSGVVTSRQGSRRGRRVVQRRAADRRSGIPREMLPPIEETARSRDPRHPPLDGSASRADGLRSDPQG